MIQYTVHYIKEEGDRTFWPKVGHAFHFEGDDNGKVTVKLDSLPLQSNWDGRLFLFTREPR